MSIKLLPLSIKSINPIQKLLHLPHPLLYQVDYF